MMLFQETLWAELEKFKNTPTKKERKLRNKKFKIHLQPLS